MKPPRTALPLLRYVERKRTRRRIGAFFPCANMGEACGLSLGLDYSIAVRRAEEILLSAFHAWRSADIKTAAAPATAAIGTLDWVFAEYRADRRFTKLDEDQAQSRARIQVGRRSRAEG
jgi:hypothetical protein